MMTLARWKVILVLLATILGLLFTVPNLLPGNVRDSLPGFMPKSTLKLGLDLQGHIRQVEPGLGPNVH